MLMTNQQAAELSEPGMGSFHYPAALITSQFAPVLVAPLLVVLPVRRDQFNASLLQSPTQRVGVVAAVGNHALGLLPRAASASRDADFGERGFRKRNFCRRGTFQPNSQRKTLTVDQYHPLRALATLGFTDGGAPFFAGAKLPSKKVSSHRSRPSSSNPPSSARQHPARRLPLATVATAASRSRARETRRVENARPRRSAESTECLPNKLDSALADGPAYLVAASVLAAKALLTAIAPRSTASVASS